MLFVEGIGFSNRDEYEKALYDKSIIDDIKKNYDLSISSDIKKAYNRLQSVHFKTQVGDRFDDEVFELYQKVKNGEKITHENVAEKNQTLQTKIPELSKVSKEIDAGAKKAIVKNNRIRITLIASLLLISVFSIGYFIKYYSDARRVQKNSEEYSELKDTKYAEILKNVQPVVKKQYSEDVVIPDILDEYVALYNKNKSLIGWIKIADTIIDYPVMQSTDNDYYLNHNFDQNKDANGCIFLDCNCDVILGNDNWILYGHHMKNGKMFSSLIKYANQEFYEEHKTITFDTIYEKGTYEIMYAFRSKIYNTDEITFKYYQFIDANSSEEFNSYMDDMAAMSLIETGVTAEYGDRLLTLSTCDYQEKNGRFVVVAKRVW